MFTILWGIYTVISLGFCIYCSCIMIRHLYNQKRGDKK